VEDTKLFCKMLKNVSEDGRPVVFFRCELLVSGSVDILKQLVKLLMPVFVGEDLWPINQPKDLTTPT